MTAAASPTDLRQAFIECRRVTRRRARNFYYGLRLAPEPKRSALFALYAWMREADDIVDAGAESIEVARARLLDFRDRTESAIRGEIGDDRPWLWTALREITAQFNLPAAHFRDMIEGQMSDLGEVEYERFADLERYCYRVASTVGLLCLGIWGYEGDDAPHRAIGRGIGFQLTNILRDFAEDFDGGRIYLPAESFRRHAITPQQVRMWSEPARCERFWAEQVALARSHFERSEPLDAMVSRDCSPVLWAMTQIYRELLEKIAAAPQRAATGRRTRLSVLRKGLIALEAGRMSRAGTNSVEPAP